MLNRLNERIPMRIERLILSNYLRLQLANIPYLDIQPTSKYQLILGTNGSGKSSILHELSPLPANPKQYGANGFKEIHITHQGHSYICTSKIGKHSRHSFLKDGVELNTGGTLRVQQDLCQQEFQYTPELHQLLTGRIRFTSMSPQERRKWLTSLSTVDHTYGLKLYNRLKSMARDFQGTERHLQNRITQETQNLQTLNIPADTEQHERRLHEEMRALIMSQTRDMASPAEYQRRHIELDRLITTTGKDAFRYQRLVGRLDSDTLESQIRTLDQSTAATEATLKQLLQEKSRLESVLQPATTQDSTALDNLDQRREEILQSLNQLPDTLEWTIDRDPVSLLQVTESILPDILELFAHIPDNSDGRYSKPKLDALNEHIRVTEANLVTIGNKLAKIDRRLSEAHTARSETCPQCQHTWKPDIRPGEVEYLHQQKRNGEQQHQEQTTLLNTLKVEQTELEQYADYVRRYRRMVSDYPELNPLWITVSERQCLTHRPNEHRGLWDAWVNTLKILVQRKTLQNALQETDDLIRHRDQLKALDRDTARYTALEAELQALYQSLQHDRQQQRQLQGQLNDYRTLIRYLDDLQRDVQVYCQNYRDHLTAIRNDGIESLLTRHQNELATVQHQLQQYRSVTTILEDLNRSHRDIQSKTLAANLLVKNISPIEGWIAEQMSGFMRCITDQMNALIETVWTYDLKVIPCSIQDGDLDYRFPLNVGSGELPADDVQLGSKAQQEIVNFAFLLTVMLYRGLQDYPLYLDELGEGFDESHRERVMTLIRQLVDTGQYAQVWMVSHFQTQWSLFQDADYLVLDTQNIAVPDQYNRHIRLEPNA